MAGSLKVWDGSAWQYVQLPQGGAIVQPGTPTSPTVGQIWYDTDDATLGGDTSDTGWIDGTSLLLNGWLNFDTRTFRYRRKNGIVYTEGIVKSGTVGANIFVYPAGFRCSNRLVHDKNLLIMANSALGTLAMDGTGAVMVTGTTSNAWVDLSGIPPFPADN